jgi:hypothetical protein
MAHVRSEIRQQVKAKLQSTSTAGANVFVESEGIISSIETPALLLKTLDESVDYEQGQMDITPLRTITFVSEAYVQQSIGSPAGFMGILDGVAEEIETVLFIDRTFGGFAQGIELGNTTYSIASDDGAEFQAGSIAIEFFIFYYVRDGAPDTAIT